MYVCMYIYLKSLHITQDGICVLCNILLCLFCRLSMTYTFSLHKVSLLTTMEIHCRNINYEKLCNFQLMMEPLETWKRAFQTLKNLGFHSDQLLPAVITIPAVFKGNLRKLIQTMDTLRALGFREKYMFFQSACLNLLV